MLAGERRVKILNLINEKGSVSIRDIQEVFKIDYIKAYRDLKCLGEDNLIKKVYGGAVKLDKLEQNEPTFDEKLSQHFEEKTVIAEYAVKNYVKNGDIIALGAGSTILRMIPKLANLNVTILTIGLQNLLYASNYAPKFSIIGSGGSIRYPALAFIGPVAESFFKEYNANIVFLSGTGLTIEEGITDPHPMDVQIKRAMINGANKVIFLMDSSKINKTSLATTIKLEEIDILITDNGAPSKFITDVKKLGVELIVAEK